MDKEEEIIKAKKIKDDRISLISVVSFTYLGMAIVILLFVQNQSPVVTQILIPLTIGVAVGLILSIISVRLSHETSIRLIEIQFALDEMKIRLVNLDEFFGMGSKESDVKPEKQKLTKQNTHTTYGELHWKPILIITVVAGIVGIVFVIYGSSQIIDSYNVKAPVSPVKFNNTEFKDTFPDTPLVSFVDLHIENNEDRLLLYKKTAFYVTLETNKEYKLANFEIFHESESNKFNSTQIGPIKQKDGSVICPHISPYQYERAFSIPLITGGASGDSPVLYNSQYIYYTFLVSGNYQYQVSFMTDDQPKNNCTLISYKSPKPFFNVPDEQTEAQIDTYKTIQIQKLEQDQNNTRNMGFSCIAAGAIPFGFSITLLPVVLNRQIRNKNSQN